MTSTPDPEILRQRPDLALGGFTDAIKQGVRDAGERADDSSDGDGTPAQPSS